MNPLPVVTNSLIANVCSGLPTTINLTGSVPSSFAWTIGNVTGGITSPILGSGNTIIQTLNNPSNTTAGTVQYLVTPTSTTGTCAGSVYSITVTVNPLPVITIAPSAVSICKGSSTILTASGAGATGTYSWSPVTGLIPTTGATVTASPAATTNYIVTGTDVNLCQNTASSKVTINPLPKLTLKNREICINDTVELPVYGAVTYLWNTGSSSDVLMINTPQPLGTSYYTVTGTDNNQCSSVASASVIVHDYPVVKINNGDGLSVNLCRGYSTSLTASGAQSYLWSSNGNTNNPISVKPTNTTQYIVTGTNTYTVGVKGCSATASINVIVISSPDITITGNTNICSGTCTLLTASDAVIQNTLSYSWSTGDKTDTTTVCATKVVTYTVTGTDVDGCKGTQNVVITVKPLPVAKFSATPNKTTIVYPNVEFIDLTSENIISRIWDLGDSHTTLDSSRFIHKYANIGNYKVILKVTDSFTCWDTISEYVYITAPPCYMYIPKAFSPENSENTSNMVFKVYIDPAVTVEGYKMTIFSRWGSLIYESNDIYKGWDGTINGSPAPEGVYVYMVNYIGCNGRTDDKPLNGTVMLFRKRPGK